MKKRMKKTLLSFFLIDTILMSNVISLTVVKAETTSTIVSERLKGNDRYETTTKIVQAGWKTNSDYAIITTGDDFPDALCAAPLAKKYNAPIMLTNRNSLNDNTKAELQRLKVKNVIIVGGIGAVSQKTESEIQELNITTRRIAGNNRYETSEKIAEEMDKSNEVVITTGVDFPDALSIASIAANKKMPILLTDANSLPDKTNTYLKGNIFTNIYVIGGQGVITDTALLDLNNTKRLYGNNRYETNLAILNQFSNELNLSNVYIATGEDFPDALAGSALAASINAPLILTNGSNTFNQKKYIDSIKCSKEVLFGGEGAISLICEWRLNGSIKENENSNTKITYKQGVEAARYSFSGMKMNLDKKNGLPLDEYNYQTKSSGDNISFLSGLSLISAYMATGEKDYIDVAKQTANFIRDNMSENNLIFEFNTEENCAKQNSEIMAGTNGQASALEYVSYLARMDSDYITLMNKLADGLINYCINPSNNLAWFKVSSSTGKPINSSEYGYESQLGSQSASCAQALLCAYETDNSKKIFKNKALDILKAIWETRNKSNNLISEAYDVMNNKVGSKLYPYNYFRYDDMGGAYIRALTMAYLVTGDSTIYDIAKVYIPALINNTWDTSINGGAFRYLTTINGTSEASYVETMHGLFIATLLEANDLFYQGSNTDIINKCTINAEHTIMDNFILKNGMSPHQINKNGNYVNTASNSQLNYTVIQYPLGYEQLSQVTQKDKYRLKDNTILNILFSRSKMGNNIDIPNGYLNIIETQSPYGFEMNYSSPNWMRHIMFVPLYMLYNSIHPSNGVKIDWYHGVAPGVFGLDSDMPYWDIKAVNVQGNSITFNNITGKGTVDFRDLGYDITGVEMDGEKYSNINNNILSTETGSHSYKIILNK